MITVETRDGIPFEGMSTFDITLTRDGKSIHCDGVIDWEFPDQEELEAIFEEWERYVEFGDPGYTVTTV